MAAELPPPNPPANLLNRWGIPKRSSLFLVAAFVAAAVLFLLIVYRQYLFTADTARTWIVLALAVAIMVIAQIGIYSGRRGNNDPNFIRYTIAYNAVIFIVVGLAALIIACKEWEMPFLMAVGSLLIGGFFGLLFGYPSGVAQQTKPVTSQGTTPASQKNLLAESASTLGKVIAGFTLAKSGQLTHYVSTVCHALAPAFGSGTTNYLMALAMLMYFVSTGFLSGLLLPSYFMAGVFAATITDPTPDPDPPVDAGKPGQQNG